jgi:methylglutaconyl-CoA hydratase
VTHVTSPVTPTPPAQSPDGSLAVEYLPGGVLHLRLNRPQRRNALDGPLLESLLATLRAVPSGGGVRALLLSGAGPAFCAGADLRWMRDGGRAPWEENLAGATLLADLLAALDACPVPTVARVHGATYGGGLGLVAAVDIAVGSDDCRFAFSEVKLGLLPAVIAPYVLSRIGEGHARALFVTGEPFGAQRAQQMGLLHAVAPLEALDAAVEDVLRELATSAPGAAGAARALIRQVRLASLGPSEALRALTAEALSSRRAGAEGQEGLSAALERRPASWATTAEPPDGKR